MGGAAGVFDGAAGGKAGGEDEAGAGGEGREVILGEPGGGFEKVRGDGIGVEELGDGFGGKVDLGDFSQDDTGDDFFAEGNEDEVTRSEFEVGRIG